MIEKIKNLITIREEIDKINGKIDEYKEIVNSLKSDISNFKEEFNGVKANQQEFLKSFKENLDLIKEMRENLGNEIYDFKLLKAQTQRKIMEKFEEELNKELGLQLENLKSNISEYDKLRNQVSDIISRTSVLSKEVDKFASISQSIKEKDFEMTNFARQLLEMDKEKLELMRKIDTLERLVSKMRRSG